MKKAKAIYEAKITKSPQHPPQHWIHYDDFCNTSRGELPASAVAVVFNGAVRFVPDNGVMHRELLKEFSQPSATTYTVPPPLITVAPEKVEGFRVLPQWLAADHVYHKVTTTHERTFSGCKCCVYDITGARIKPRKYPLGHRRTHALAFEAAAQRKRDKAAVEVIPLIAITLYHLFASCCAAFTLPAYLPASYLKHPLSSHH